MRPLFVTGCQRSGTTAFAEYLNDHPEVLVCRERYKYIPRQVTFDHFSFERILKYSKSETNVPEEQFVQLLSRKDPARLKWLGDKNPDYYKLFRRLLRQNPGAHFIVLYRPLEEVAESFESRAKDPKDHWPVHYDFERAIMLWNLALTRTREFIESDQGGNVLIIDYHDFFYRNKTCAPLISRFLDLELDDTVLESWRNRSMRFGRTRRRKNELNKEQISLIQNNKDHAVEKWILNRIERQSSAPELFLAKHSSAPLPSPQRSGPKDQEQHIEDLRRRLKVACRKADELARQNCRLIRKRQELEEQLRAIQSSRSWRLLRALGRVKARLTSK